MTISIVPASSQAREKITARTEARYGARHVLWRLSGLKRVRACGRVTRGRTDEAGEYRSGVDVKVSQHEDGSRTAGFSGIATCGSVWACPVCSAKIAAVRAAEMEQAISAWQARGGFVAFATFTVRHQRRDALATVWQTVSDAWTAAHSGRAWHAEQTMLGAMVERTITRGKRKGETVTEPRIPVIRVSEVTHGANGWHVHIHALLFLGGHVAPASVIDLGRAMFARWSASVVAGGGVAPSLKHGHDIRLLDGGAGEVGKYLSKATYEAARGDMKTGRSGNRHPFQILRGLVEAHHTGDLGDRTVAQLDQDEAIWREWEAGSKGRRQVVWSHGLRADLLPDVEDRTDDEIAADDGGGDVVAVIPAETWKTITASRGDYTVKSAFEHSTEAGRALVADVARLGAPALSAYRRRHSAQQNLSETNRRG